MADLTRKTEGERKKFWGRPGSKSAGDANPDDIYLAVGKALSEWESVEEALTFLFMVFTECDQANTFRAVQRAFGSIEFNSGRRRALNAAAEIYFEPYWDYARKDLNALIISEVDAAARRRDDIAHGRVISFAVDKIYRGSLLVPPAYNTGRTYATIPKDEMDPVGIFKARYRWVAVDVTRIAEKFNQLRQRIQIYTKKIAKQDGQMPREFIEQAQKFLASNQ